MARPLAPATAGTDWAGCDGRIAAERLIASETARQRERRAPDFAPLGL
jgi:hypothetical protein